MKIDRRATDLFFKHVFKITSAFSVVALAAIVFFVFFQGIEPFIKPTAPAIRLVTENIQSIEVDGKEYTNHRTYIDLPKGVETVRLRFINSGEPLELDLFFNPEEEDPQKLFSYSGPGTESYEYPEAYVHSLEFPGTLPGLEQRIHIILPEPAYGVSRFVLGMDWRPTYNKVYGIFPMIAATVLSTLGAILIGVPIALLTAVFLSEFLPRRIAVLLRSSIELLAGIPSVVYGFFGLMVIVPFLKDRFDAASGSSILAAMIILSIMILPTVISISETSLRAVPQAYREASLALGATKMQTSWSVVVPPARSGIITAIILGISRAVGETMAVILVAGNSPQLPTSLLDSVRTLTATIALEMGYAQGRHSQALFSVGIVLFVMIFMLNATILYMRRRIPESE